MKIRLQQAEYKTGLHRLHLQTYAQDPNDTNGPNFWEPWSTLTTNLVGEVLGEREFFRNGANADMDEPCFAYLAAGGFIVPVNLVHRSGFEKWCVVKALPAEFEIDRPAWL